MSKWLDNAIFYQIYPQSFCDTKFRWNWRYKWYNEKIWIM